MLHLSSLELQDKGRRGLQTTVRATAAMWKSMWAGWGPNFDWDNIAEPGKIGQEQEVSGLWLEP